MARDPADRPATAAKFGDELREIQRSYGVTVDEMARPVELVERPVRPGRGQFIGIPAPPRRPRHPRREQPGLRGNLPHHCSPAAGPPRRPSRRRTATGRSIGTRPWASADSTLAAQWREELLRWRRGRLADGRRRRQQRGVVPGASAGGDPQGQRTSPVPLEQVLEDHGDDASRYVFTSLIDEIHEKTIGSQWWSTTGIACPTAKPAQPSVSFWTTVATTCRSS